MIGVNHACFRPIVGNLQQRFNELFVAIFYLLRSWGLLLEHKATFCAGGNNDGVLHHLGFHQTQHFCAKILRPFAPANSAAGDLAAAKMNAFKMRRSNEDFIKRPRLRHLKYLPALDLDCQRKILRIEVVIRADAGLNYIKEAA